MRILSLITLITSLVFFTNCGKDEIEIFLDITPPIALFNINDGDQDVPLDTDITITFNEPIFDTNGNRIDNTSIRAFVILKENNVNGPDVPFNVFIDGSGQLVSIEPTSLLKPDQLYFIQLEAVRDEDGSFGSTIFFTFTTSSIDLAGILTKWSITNEVLNTYDDSGNLIMGNAVSDFLSNQNTIEFEGSAESGEYRSVLVGEAFLLRGNYEVNPTDSTIVVDVVNSSFTGPSSILLKILSISGTMLELQMTTEVVDDGADIVEERFLTLFRNDSNVPVIEPDDLIGEWSATSLVDNEFMEINAMTNDFEFVREYNLQSIPENRITFAFEATQALFVDAYFTGSWFADDFEYFDGSNFIFGGRFIHLTAVNGPDELEISVTNIEDDVINEPDTKFITDYVISRNDGTAFSTTQDALVATWLVTGSTEFEDGVDVTDPNDEDSALGTLITFNADGTGLTSNDGGQENIEYNFLDGNSFELVILDVDEQVEILFHIVNIDETASPHTMTVVAGRVEDEDNCSTNCDRVRFEFELVLEKQD